MVNFNHVRVIVSLVVKHGWKAPQFDVNNAFLHGDLHEELYMKAPPGLFVPYSSYVCWLQKFLYGLKKASWQWYSKLSIALSSMGFSHFLIDHLLFLKKDHDSIVIVAIYVDDILVSGNNCTNINDLKTFLDDQFKIKDLEFNDIPGGMVVNQHKFTLVLLQAYCMEVAESVSTPLPANLRFLPEMDNPLPIHVSLSY